MADLIDNYRALIGECAWHSLTVDPTLKTVSDGHYNYLNDSFEERDSIIYAFDDRVGRMTSRIAFPQTIGNIVFGLPTKAYQSLPWRW